MRLIATSTTPFKIVQFTDLHHYYVLFFVTISFVVIIFIALFVFLLPQQSFL